MNEEKRIASEVYGLIYVFVGLFLLLSLITYHPDDPGFNQVVSDTYVLKNNAGLVGAYMGGILVDLFGIGAYFIALSFLLIGVKSFIRRFNYPWWRIIGGILAGICIINWASAPWMNEHISVGHIHGGGFIGSVLYTWSKYYLRTYGALLFWLFLFLTSIQLVAGTTWSDTFKRIKARLVDFWLKHRERIIRKLKRRLKPNRREITKDDKEPVISEVDEEAAGKIETFFPSLFNIDEDPEPSARKATPKPRKTPKKPEKSAPIDKTEPGDIEAITLPQADLLEAVPESTTNASKEKLDELGEIVKACLADFGVQGEIKDISPGPVITMFEFKPAPGVKISRIAGLSDDLALALKAGGVRIEAPLAGRNTVGIEVPNDNREIVHLRDILESKLFSGNTSLLTLALGKDISGKPHTADLSKMPHLLVAGATGAGKSVCLNTILLSFLYKAKPEELKLLLIDPKRIELSVYGKLPHLVHPVVTEMSQAKNALDWAVLEMDRRYQAMAELGVRNIESYNNKLKKLEKSANVGTEGQERLEPIPYLVIIIDELADLMLTAAKEVEMSIVRLAQLARAAGIHMILATQRPSVDVVTGLIKANFPCRIAFQVTSKHDSRTILDSVGAERLLGKGDMLFKPGGGQMKRLHGAFVGDDDVAAVVNFWRAQDAPEFELDFANWKPGGDDGEAGASGELIDDEKYQEAVDFVIDQGKASISLIQRRFRIGYNRAARFIEQMESDGIIGPSEGSKPRTVLKTYS